MERDGVTRILLVDDDRNLFEYYKRIFEKRLEVSVQIDDCVSGEQLKDRLSGTSYDIVILDQRLSDGERGVDLIPIIKERSPETRIVLNSAYGNEDLAVESLRRGVDDYVCGNKVNDDMLIEAIHRVMSGIRMEIQIGDIIERERKEILDLSSCCEEKMRRLKDRVGKMSQVVAS